VQVGDLVRTIVGWSYKTWTGVVVELEITSKGDEWANVLWTEASTTDGQIFWQPTSKLEVISASR
tara:strand:+ start:5227 stop:5421 length:195 start_codon:yes stop_codon:yes gene_type:complete